MERGRETIDNTKIRTFRILHPLFCFFFVFICKDLKDGQYVTMMEISGAKWKDLLLVSQQSEASLYTSILCLTIGHWKSQRQNYASDIRQ